MSKESEPQPAPAIERKRPTPTKDDHTFLHKKVLNADGQEIISDPFNVSAFREFMLHLRIVETGDPDNSTVETIVQFLNTRSGEWHDYENGPFGLLLYEEDAIGSGARGLAVNVSGRCVGKVMRVKIVAAEGTTLDADNYFTVTVDAEFMD